MNKLICYFIIIGLITGFAGCLSQELNESENSISTNTNDSVEEIIYAGDIEFSYTPLAGTFPQDVYLVGEMNEWIKEDASMKMMKSNDIFYLTLRLKAGMYQYKLYIDGFWIAQMDVYGENINPKPSEYLGDGFGGYNAVIEVYEWE